MTTRTVPANIENKPSKPKDSINEGFIFERKNVNVISRVMKNPTMVDLKFQIIRKKKNLFSHLTSTGIISAATRLRVANY